MHVYTLLVVPVEGDKIGLVLDVYWIYLATNLLTFTTCEQEVLCGIQRQHRLSVPLCCMRTNHRGHLTGWYLSCIGYYLPPVIQVNITCNSIERVVRFVCFGSPLATFLDINWLSFIHKICIQLKSTSSASVNIWFLYFSC